MKQINEDIAFKDIYNLQIGFQSLLTKKGLNDIKENTMLPIDDITLFSQHLQHLISELGEVLAADKRWKNFRNDKYDKENKKEELADCFIVLMNMCIYSGFESKEILIAVVDKILKNHKRIENL